MSLRWSSPRSPPPAHRSDTVIYADSLARSYGCRVELTAGEYEWSVTGFNGGYRTRTEVRSLTVTAPADTETPEP